MKCSRIPFLYVTKDNTIQIKCLCPNRIMNLNDYIHQLKISNKTIKTHISYCEEVLSHCNNKSKGIVYYVRNIFVSSVLIIIRNYVIVIRMKK